MAQGGAVITWDHGRRARIVVDGTALECATWGPPPSEATTLVLLHEGLGCVDLWRSFPETLARQTGLGVFAYSRAGYGRSDAVRLPRPLDYMTREAVDVLPGVLDRIGPRRAILIGHSDGATIAAIHAGTIRDPRLCGIVLIAPHFFAEEVGLRAIAEARGAYETGDLRRRLARYHDHPDIAFHGWNDAWLAPGFRTWIVADVIDDIDVPVMAMQGDADQYGTLAQIEEIERRARVSLTISVLPDCGHAPHLEQPEATLAGIGAFVSRVMPDGAGMAP